MAATGIPPTIPEPSHEPRVFTNDPVRVAWIAATFVQAVIAILLLASVISEVVGGILIGVVTAGYAAISELFVRPATVPRAPLEDLARHEAEDQEALDAARGIPPDPLQQPPIRLTDPPEGGPYGTG